jgi:predicted helicase
LQFENSIKWSRNIKEKIKRGAKEYYDAKKIVRIGYRPFIKKWLYNSPIFIDERGNSNDLFGPELNLTNIGIAITGPNSGKPFLIKSISTVNDYHFVGSGASTQFFPLYKYDRANTSKLDNITNWGLNQFTKRYGKKGITKEAIFNYVYAVLHNPAYREKYELNLKREFPRIPFYEDFKQWSAWGKVLMDFHINYESVAGYPLKETTLKDITSAKAKLKANKETGAIIIDEATTLTGIPAQAWQYKLGNRSALEWVLDQYKESKPKDPTIAEKFNTYKFADYKAQVIDLLKRVCTVSVETMKIIDEMKAAQPEK